MPHQEGCTRIRRSGACAKRSWADIRMVSISLLMCSGTDFISRWQLRARARRYLTRCTSAISSEYPPSTFPVLRASMNSPAHEDRLEEMPASGARFSTPMVSRSRAAPLWAMKYDHAREPSAQAPALYTMEHHFMQSRMEECSSQTLHQ